MTEKKERRKYTKEFKIEAVELARSHGGAAAVIARDLGIRPNMLYRWMSEYELVYDRTYGTRREARQSVFRYIEIFYNRIRKHSSLGNLSPDQFTLLKSAA